MKVLALNSSPRGEGQSKTELMLSHLVAGMREAGAEVDVVQLRRKKISPCIGCFTCWTKTPGVCLHKDDMTQDLYPRWLEADLVVYASPLYHFTVNAVMKAFIERTLPILQPFFEEHKAATSHPLRRKPPEAVMLSVAGFPEDTVFNLLSSWARFIFQKGLVAEIYRAGAETLTVPYYAPKAREIFAATVQAGRELATARKITPETMTLVRQPIEKDLKLWHMMGNLMWKTCIAQGITPKEFEAQGLVPRPDSLESFMAILPMGFNPQAAGDARAVIQFDFSGEAVGTCHFRIEKGTMTALAGAADAPDLTIKAPFGLWLDIMTGTTDGGQAFMEQKYEAAGDLNLLIGMKAFFQR